MQFKQGVGVHTSAGKVVGQLDRVVVDPRTKEVNYVVVRKGTFFTKDKVVPLTLVAKADEGGITLREDAGDLTQLPDFEARYYVPASEEPTAVAADIPTAPTVYPYPPVVGGEMAGLGNINTQASLGALTVQEPVIERTERAIPDNDVAIQSGARVMSADGRHVGSVEQVLTGENADRATHFVITQGVLFKDRKLIPMGWVSELGESEVLLAVDADFLGKLPDYHEAGEM